MAKSTGAEHLVKAAIDCGVNVVFANPGTSEMHFVAAMDSARGCHPILTLHETCATGAADGYGRMNPSRKPALTLLHLGPGLANGLCNLHNARRAGTPIINLVGDMAVWHKDADPLLNIDIPGLAKTVSKRVIQCQPGDDLYSKMAEAIRESEKSDEVSGSKVVTVIVPHDLSWSQYAESPAREKSVDSAINTTPQLAPHPSSPTLIAQSTSISASLNETEVAFIKECASALKNCPKGNAALYIGGRAGLRDDDALLYIGRIAAATGAAIYCENAFARMDRGVGAPVVERLPYFPTDALNTLNKFQVLVLVDVRRPVANFGYENGPSQLVQLDDDSVWELDSADMNIPAALKLLSFEVGGQDIKPFVNCRQKFCSPARPTLPTGRLNPTTMCQTISALQPENAIIVDESLTSGNTYWEFSKGCPPFSHLTLTGGAIGCGPPLSLGAAVACRNRTVINIQADGSGMYSLQALWTQAREGLKVVTIVCANRTYAILKVEMAKQRITPANGRAAKSLTEIGQPTIDWVALATGMGVTASRSTSVEELAQQLTKALDRDGPSLIEAVL